MKKLQEYKNHDYCRDVDCIHLSDDNTTCTIASCTEPAKAFHIWLTKNGYKIVKIKETKDNENRK